MDWQWRLGCDFVYSYSLLPNYVALHPRRQQSSWSKLWVRLILPRYILIVSLKRYPLTLYRSRGLKLQLVTVKCGSTIVVRVPSVVRSFQNENWLLTSVTTRRTTNFMKCTGKWNVTFKVAVKCPIQLKRLNYFLINLIQNMQLTHNQVYLDRKSVV